MLFIFQFLLFDFCYCEKEHLQFSFVCWFSQREAEVHGVNHSTLLAAKAARGGIDEVICNQRPLSTPFILFIIFPETDE